METKINPWRDIYMTRLTKEDTKVPEHVIIEKTMEKLIESYENEGQFNI